MNTCEIVQKESQLVISVRTRAAIQDLPMVIGKIYGQIGAYLGGIGEMPAGAPFVAYYNMDMQDLDLEIAFPVAKPIAAKDDMQMGEIPGGKHVTLQ